MNNQDAEQAMARALLVAKAYQQWMEHAQTCKDCKGTFEMVDQFPPSVLRDAAFWQLGFNACMDLVSSGQLLVKPSKVRQSHPSQN